VAPDATPSPTRSALIAEIKQLEAASAALQGTSGPLHALQETLDVKRAMLKSLKPLGQRLDATRAAVERAAKRRVQAEEAKLLAEGVLTKAIDEEEQLKKELSTLEASVGLDGVMHDAAAGSPIRTLGEALFTVVSQLRGMQAVDPSVAADAQTQCEHLFAKVCATVEAAEAAKCNAEAASATSRRLRGKQANASERAVPVTVSRRLAGKRKVHTPLTSFRGHPKMRRSLLNPGLRLRTGAGEAVPAANPVDAPHAYGPAPHRAGATSAGPYSQ